ncbi:DUF3093 domain-containing protein [Leucobacter sp. CSA1]|uniref:DUF3093 domain-containing protein n=1 Tax=Leucobacter chromiisoli TaxID=2796471 RepID=A0A934UUD1_9MICO|nr:DUF3093 domain-containing protein [Leucobacter chromiisoli]MBK0418068.1 DUF3093 domain-containing protein [Leucobacter chromiisoli]
MNNASTAPGDRPVTRYRERLWPGAGLFIALLLVVPAVALVLTPIDGDIAVPVAIAVYVIVAATLLLLSPSVEVEAGTLSAARARIPVSLLGEPELLDADALRRALGPGIDARSYLVVRGWIHRGVRIPNLDPRDPAPYWIITSRRPQELASAIRSAR